MKLKRIWTVAITATLLAACGNAFAQVGTAFRYQGSLEENGTLVDGLTDFRFELWDDPAAGLQYGPTLEHLDVNLVRGLFTVELDFGEDPWVPNIALWLKIEVRTGSGGYTTLSPRQRLTPTPFSLNTRGISVDEDGWVGICERDPLAELHVVGEYDLRLDDSQIFDAEDCVIEAEWAWLGLHSTTGKPYGSGLNLAEHDRVTDLLNDNWAIYRETSPNDSDLKITYGGDVDPGANEEVLRIDTDGNVGIGETDDPLARLHVRNLELPGASGFQSSYENDIIVEASNSWLGLYSDDGGGIGSGLTFAEIADAPANNNKWSIYRRTSSNVGDLNFTFGSDSNPGANDKVMLLKQNGDAVVVGEIQKCYTGESTNYDPGAPLAYGCVSDDAVPVLTAKTANVASVTWIGDRYEIEVTDVTLDIDVHTILLTTNGRINPTIATAYTSAGKLWVTCWNTNTGNKIQQDFSFLIYEANH